MFTNGRSEVANLFWRWLVGEVAVGIYFNGEWGMLRARLFLLFPSAGVAVRCLQTINEVADLFSGAGQQHMKDHIEIGHLTKSDAFRMNRDQATDLQILFKIHTNVSTFDSASPKTI